MSGTWGDKIKFSIFGESHGVAIGGVIDGIKAGTKIDFDKIDVEMKRRNHRAFYSTARDEKDEYEVLSGIKDGIITAPLTFAGSVARQILENDGIKIVSHIYSIGEVNSRSILDTPLCDEEIKKLHSMEFPVLCEETKNKMEEEISKYKSDLNSVGGIVECAVYGMKAGVGFPFFGSVESEISRMMFSIPAVKGIEFGKGFEISKMNGYDANDKYFINDGKVVTQTNNNGGILGGITNGMPIVFKVAIKPTPSIFKTQKTVNLKTNTNDEITLKGRHDACIVPRALAVVEAGTALVLLNLLEG